MVGRKNANSMLGGGGLFGPLLAVSRCSHYGNSSPMNNGFVSRSGTSQSGNAYSGSRLRFQPVNATPKL
jgi:hypothetical protein